MAGRHVNDGQARQYMRHRRNGHAVETATQAGFSRATGYRLEADPRLPSAKRKRRGVTVPLLERNPGRGRWRRGGPRGCRSRGPGHGATRHPLWDDADATTESRAPTIGCRRPSGVFRRSSRDRAFPQLASPG